MSKKNFDKINELRQIIGEHSAILTESGMSFRADINESGKLRLTFGLDCPFQVCFFIDFNREEIEKLIEQLEFLKYKII